MTYRTVFAIWASAMTPCAFAETDAERQACMADAQTHCADQIPDRERVYQCLVQKVKLISAPCQKLITGTLGPKAQQPRR